MNSNDICFGDQVIFGADDSRTYVFLALLGARQITVGSSLRLATPLKTDQGRPLRKGEKERTS